MNESKALCIGIVIAIIIVLIMYLMHNDSVTTAEHLLPKEPSPRQLALGLLPHPKENFEGLSYYNATHNPWYNDWYRPWAGNNCYNKSGGCFGRSACCN